MRAFSKTLLLGTSLALAPAYAHAACTPTSGTVNPGDTVTCSGTTTDQDNPHGYGTNTTNGITLNVENGATINATADSILLNDDNIVNNAGTLNPGMFGIVVNDRNTITNQATGSISGTASIVGGASNIVTNLGTMNNSLDSIFLSDNNTITNSGTITSSGDEAIDVGDNNTIINLLGGSISGTGDGIEGNDNNTITNADTIHGDDNGVSLLAGATITNRVTGFITGGSAFGVTVSNDATVNNAGVISGQGTGLAAVDNNSITNSGAITGTTSNAILLLGGNTVTNTGTLNGGSSGIRMEGDDNTITSSGGITGVDYGMLALSNSNILTNSGTINATAGDGILVTGQSNVITNSGAITATGSGIYADNGNNTILNSGTINAGAGIATNGPQISVINSGTINANVVGMSIVSFTNVVNSGTINSGGIGVSIENTVNFLNSGRINATTFGLSFDNNSSIGTNTGTIIGDIGLFIDAGRTNNHFINYGLVEGTGGLAINSSTTFDNFLTFMPGSRLIGDIRAGSNDTLTYRGGNHLQSFVGPNDPTTLNINTGGMPYVATTTQVAVFDTSALAMEDRALMDVTGGISGALGDRLSLASPRSEGKTTIWASGFGSARNQSDDGVISSTDHITSGVQAGADRVISSSLTLGAFVGGGKSRTDVDNDIQTVDSDHVFGGIYGQYDMGAPFLSFALFGGTSDNDSKRLISDSSTVSGLDTRTASYDGTFIAPEIGVGYRIPVGNTTFIPYAKIRHLSADIDGYNDGNASLSSRNIQTSEARIEVSALQALGALETRATLGALASHRFGDDSMSGTLIGTPISFSTPGDDTTGGGYGGLGVTYRLLGGASLSANANLAVLDEGTVASARVGAAMEF